MRMHMYTFYTIQLQSDLLKKNLIFEQNQLLKLHAFLQTVMMIVRWVDTSIFHLEVCENFYSLIKF